VSTPAGLPVLQSARVPVHALYVLDANVVPGLHDAIVDGNADLRDHLLIVNRSLAVMAAIARDVVPRDAAELEGLKLVARAFNSGLAAQQLARSGLWNASVAMMRDVLEVEFLLDLFARDRAELEAWAVVDDKGRKQRFGADKVRRKLDRAYGHTTQGRFNAYQELSEFGTHATRQGHALMHDGERSIIGPFSSEKLFRGLLELMANRFPSAASMARGHAYDDATPMVDLAEKLQGELLIWRATYRADDPTPPP
jgi:hypothetical protein